MPSKTKMESAELPRIKSLQQKEMKFRIIGTSPLVFNSMSRKAREALFIGAKRKTAKEKQDIKHNPELEFQDSLYTQGQGTAYLSFPSTGKYLVIVNAQYNLNGSDSISLDTKITTNNSSYTAIARAIDGANGTGVRQGNGMSIAFIDVTDVSQVKIQFSVGSIGTSSSLMGNNAFTTTTFTFAKIGDT